MKQIENKHKLTESLKVIETEIHDLKVDLRAINTKLESAYQYEQMYLLCKKTFLKSRVKFQRNTEG